MRVTKDAGSSSGQPQCHHRQKQEQVKSQSHQEDRTGGGDDWFVHCARREYHDELSTTLLVLLAINILRRPFNASRGKGDDMVCLSIAGTGETNIEAKYYMG